jgi:8-oxo-dGTP pyrophosphatase MutT (NUDIX family)
MLYSLIDDLKKGFSQELPGQQAQYKMVPPGRERTRLENITYSNPKRAAVLVLVYPKQSEPHIVLMKRNSYPGVHSDQISFPGGKLEAFDENLQQAAVRESNEELGILPDHVSILGELTQVYIPPSNFLVNPFVGFSEERPDFIPDNKEVTEVLEVSVSDILNPKNLEMVNLDLRGKQIEAPAYILNGHVVWGATAMMLSELSHLIQK